MIELMGKRALVVGVANDQSIAWGVAQALRQTGARLAITYLNEKAEQYVRPLAERVGAEIIMPLDVTRDEHEEPLFARIAELWGAASIFWSIRSLLRPAAICTVGFSIRARRGSRPRWTSRFIRSFG